MLIVVAIYIHTIVEDVLAIQIRALVIINLALAKVIVLVMLIVHVIAIIVRQMMLQQYLCRGLLQHIHLECKQEIKYY
jgi:hypothetical protein